MLKLVPGFYSLLAGVSAAMNGGGLASPLHSEKSSNWLGGVMRTTLNPYLNFRDDTRKAMEFYRTVFGGKLDINTFKDLHASTDPSEDGLIMHSVLEADGIT